MSGYGYVQTGRGPVFTQRQGGALAALALVVLAGAMASLVPAFVVLEVREWRRGRLLYLAPVRPQSRFEVTFVHSVERTPVREVFTVGPDLDIYLVETVYESFGAGLPTTAEEGARFVLEGGTMRITGLHRRIGQLVLSVSPVPGHVLRVANRAVTLADLADPGTALGIKVVRVPAAAFFFRGRCWWMRR